MGITILNIVFSIIYYLLGVYLMFDQQMSKISTTVSTKKVTSIQHCVTPNSKWQTIFGQHPCYPYKTAFFLINIQYGSHQTNSSPPKFMTTKVSFNLTLKSRGVRFYPSNHRCPTKLPAYTWTFVWKYLATQILAVSSVWLDYHKKCPLLFNNLLTWPKLILHDFGQILLWPLGLKSKKMDKIGYFSIEYKYRTIFWKDSRLSIP